MEMIEKFDNKRIPLNKKIERYHPEKGEYEQATHLWIMNDKGEFLMQKRSMKKKIFPGKWSVTGGAVDVGEKSIDGMYRECKEEIGVDLNPKKVELMMTLKRKYAFIDIYLDREEFDLDDITLQEDEVDEVKWFSRDEINELIKNKEVGTSIILYFQLLCDLIDEENI